MQSKFKSKFIKITFLLCIVMLVVTEIKSQNDAYFYEYNIERGDDFNELNINGFGAKQGYGLAFDIFGNDFNGFTFNGFEEDGDGFDFGDFHINPEDVPIGSGILMLAGFALLWRKRKAMRDEP